MNKAIARLGIACTFSLCTSPLLASSVGDLLISEVMANPAALSDSAGEWFELYNPTDAEINLRGIELGDDGSNSHRFDSDLLILPRHFLTLARSSAPGFVPDYVYDDFVLSNSADEIVLRDGPLELLRLDYGAGFSVAGRTRELSQLPMTAANYGLTLASLGYGAGDIGTPGRAGGGKLFAPSAVPLPAAAWLFASALLALFTPRIGRAFRSPTRSASALLALFSPRLGRAFPARLRSAAGYIRGTCIGLPVNPPRRSHPKSSPSKTSIVTETGANFVRALRPVLNLSDSLKVIPVTDSCSFVPHDSAIPDTSDRAQAGVPKIPEDVSATSISRLRLTAGCTS